MEKEFMKSILMGKIDGIDFNGFPDVNQKFDSRASVNIANQKFCQFQLMALKMDQKTLLCKTSPSTYIDFFIV